MCLAGFGYIDVFHLEEKNVKEKQGMKIWELKLLAFEYKYHSSCMKMVPSMQTKSLIWEKSKLYENVFPVNQNYKNPFTNFCSQKKKKKIHHLSLYLEEGK